MSQSRTRRDSVNNSYFHLTWCGIKIFFLAVIQICNVKPVPDANNPILKAHVPEKIQAYYNINNVDAFSFDRRLKKFVQEDPDNQNEFKVSFLKCIHVIL